MVALLAVNWTLPASEAASYGSTNETLPRPVRPGTVKRGARRGDQLAGLTGYGERASLLAQTIEVPVNPVPQSALATS